MQKIRNGTSRGKSAANGFKSEISSVDNQPRRWKIQKNPGWIKMAAKVMISAPDMVISIARRQRTANWGSWANPDHMKIAATTNSNDLAAPSNDRNGSTELKRFGSQAKNVTMRRPKSVVFTDVVKSCQRLPRVFAKIRQISASMSEIPSTARPTTTMGKAIPTRTANRLAKVFGGAFIGSGACSSCVGASIFVGSCGHGVTWGQSY